MLLDLLFTTRATDESSLVMWFKEGNVLVGRGLQTRFLAASGPRSWSSEGCRVVLDLHHPEPPKLVSAGKGHLKRFFSFGNNDTAKTRPLEVLSLRDLLSGFALWNYASPSLSFKKKLALPSPQGGSHILVLSN